MGADNVQQQPRLEPKIVSAKKKTVFTPLVIQHVTIIRDVWHASRSISWFKYQNITDDVLTYAEPTNPFQQGLFLVHFRNR